MDQIEVFKVEKNLLIEIEKEKIEFSLDSLIDIEPSNGKLGISDDSLTYTPKKDFVGKDFFSFTNKQKKTTVIFEVQDIVFKPRARMLLQLGDQLIKDENIALLELVKNSYDADADTVTIAMENIDSTSKGIIQIEDNGIGMDIETVINVWMEPGSDFKAQQLAKKEVSNKYKRLPIGEKGIGRFGVHKLGEKVEIHTKRKGCNEITIKIDWSDFKSKRYLDSVPVLVVENDVPVHFRDDRTGMFIEIEDIRTPWNRRMAREAYRALGALKSPFTIDIYSTERERKKDFFRIKEIKKKDVFNVDIDIHNSFNESWLSDLPKFDAIAEYALYSFYTEIENDSLSTFEYKFSPWDTIKKISGREVSRKDNSVQHLLDLEKSVGGKSKKEFFSLEGKGIGVVKVRGIVFSLDNALNPYGLQGKKKFISDYLKSNGGVKVFRDGLRVYNYGERDADWLGLDLKRVNSPGTKLSNNLVIIEVHLNRETSTALIEKTNREGFVEDETYEYFRDAVTHALNAFATCWNTDKVRLKEIIGISARNEPVLSILKDTRKFIETDLKEISDTKKKKLIFNLNQIERDYLEITKTLQTAAGAGLNMSVIVHEIEKILKETRLVLESDKASSRALKLVAHMQKLIAGYTTIIRRSGVKNIDLAKTITDALFNVSYRLKVHGIKTIKEYTNNPSPYFVYAASNLLIGSIMNIVDNSIYWLDKSRRESKEIFINIEKDNKHTYLVIADNGTGFTIPTDLITKPFVSGKINGMGLGLHITNEIMTGMNADILFPEHGDYKIPDKFKNGAVVVIRFKNSNKK